MEGVSVCGVWAETCVHVWERVHGGRCSKEPTASLFWARPPRTGRPCKTLAVAWRGRHS